MVVPSVEINIVVDEITDRINYLHIYYSVRWPQQLCHRSNSYQRENLLSHHNLFTQIIVEGLKFDMELTELTRITLLDAVPTDKEKIYAIRLSSQGWR